MDDHWARQALDTVQDERCGPKGTFDPNAPMNADDPFGDEAAFPSIWQCPGRADAARD
ncbi:MAG: hypothetical protein ABW032_00445 [Burkholderiaceae bacterium]